MPEIVQGESVCKWVCESIHTEYRSGTSTAIGLQRNGEILAGVLYEDWNQASIVCHLAISGYVCAAFLRAICEYPFYGLKVRKIIAPVWSDNARMIQLAPKMGFMLEGRIVDAQPNGDILLFTMTAKQCKFLAERYGKR